MDEDFEQVSSKDFKNRFGEYVDAAMAHPVVVTHHKRPRLVVMSVAEFQRLKRRDRKVLDVQNVSDADRQELVAALDANPPERRNAELDHEMADYKP